MTNRKWLALLLAGVLTLGVLTGCGGTQSAQGTDTPETEETAEENVTLEEAAKPEDDGIFRIAKQGVFAAGGTVT